MQLRFQRRRLLEQLRLARAADSLKRRLQLRRRLASRHRLSNCACVSRRRRVALLLPILFHGLAHALGALVVGLVDQQLPLHVDLVDLLLVVAQHPLQLLSRRLRRRLRRRHRALGARLRRRLTPRAQQQRALQLVELQLELLSNLPLSQLSHVRGTQLAAQHLHFRVLRLRAPGWVAGNGHAGNQPHHILRAVRKYAERREAAAGRVRPAQQQPCHLRMALSALEGSRVGAGRWGAGRSGTAGRMLGGRR